jgi:curved DNA-binding protein CbpA
MTSRERLDPYIVLGVAREASVEEIGRAYRRAARTSHPDGGGDGSAERFRAVSDAYDELRDPLRRAAYDRSHPPARSPTPTAAPRGSVRYAAPGSQHLVLGGRAPSAVEHPQVSVADVDEARFVRQCRDTEEMFRIALRLLRAGW